MILINLDDVLKQFPKADFDGDALENMKAYPHWKTDITGLFNILKSVPIIESCEDCISRETVKDMLTTEWTKYMPMEADVNLSFVLEKISELPSVTLKTSEKEHKIGVAYICDGEKCPKCLKPCKHTYDISHAKNFRPIMSIDRKTVIDYEEVDKNGRTEK